MTRVGKFTVDGGIVRGPKEYMESDNYQDTAREIADGTHTLLPAFAPDTPLEQIIGVIVQTDYAGWVGEQELLHAILKNGG